MLQKRYVHGPGADEPLAEYTGSGVRTFLHADERGSIVARSDASGAKTAINSYDEYGIPAAGNTGRFQYTGQTWLGQLGMYYYKARMYSPSLGRFMQGDPIGYGDGMNWYAYVHNSPTTGTDSKGTDDDGGYVTGSHIRKTGEDYVAALSDVGVRVLYLKVSLAQYGTGGGGQVSVSLMEGASAISTYNFGAIYGSDGSLQTLITPYAHIEVNLNSLTKLATNHFQGPKSYFTGKYATLGGAMLLMTYAATNFVPDVDGIHIQAVGTLFYSGNYKEDVGVIRGFDMPTAFYTMQVWNTMRVNSQDGKPYYRFVNMYPGAPTN